MDRTPGKFEIELHLLMAWPNVQDYEGFSFSTPAPWYEFPILADGDIFDGSTSPGADRVIFDQNGNLTGVLTHTGASGDDFLECNYN